VGFGLKELGERCHIAVVIANNVEEDFSRCYVAGGEELSVVFSLRRSI
jgi:hypothetical protein